jgi:hypothetical protein
MNVHETHLRLKESLTQLAIKYQDLIEELNRTGFYAGRREAVNTANQLMQIVKRVEKGIRKDRTQAPPPNLFAAPNVPVIQEPEFEERTDVNDHPADKPKAKRERAKRDKVLASTQDWKNEQE